MSYCTRQDMTDRFGESELIQLTDRENVGVIDDAVLDRAIADAGDLIDGYMGRYQLPLASIPGVLVRCGCDVARYFLYDDAVSEAVEKRFQDTRKFLEQIAKGTVTLGLDDTGSTPATSDGATMNSGGRVFSRDDKGFI